MCHTGKYLSIPHLWNNEKSENAAYLTLKRILTVGYQLERRQRPCGNYRGQKLPSGLMEHREEKQTQKRKSDFAYEHFRKSDLEWRNTDKSYETQCVPELRIKKKG